MLPNYTVQDMMIFVNNSSKVKIEKLLMYSILNGDFDNNDDQNNSAYLIEEK